jgi:hypothetical protein
MDSLDKVHQSMYGNVTCILLVQLIYVNKKNKVFKVFSNYSLYFM